MDFGIISLLDRQKYVMADLIYEIFVMYPIRQITFKGVISIVRGFKDSEKYPLFGKDRTILVLQYKIIKKLSQQGQIVTKSLLFGETVIAPMAVVSLVDSCQWWVG